MNKPRDEYGQFEKTLPRYISDGKSYLELHAHRTLWKLNIPDGLCQDDLDYISWHYDQTVIDVAREFFELTGVDIYLLGRSARHVCVKDTPENSKRYQHLKRIAEGLELDVIKEVEIIAKAIAHNQMKTITRVSKLSITE